MINVTVSRMANGGWSYTWAVGTPNYQIWLDGLLLTTVAVEAYECVLPGYETVPPDLEIINSGEVAENSLYPPRYLIQWRGLVNAVAYVLQEYDGAAWDDLITVMETGEGYYNWLSPAKVDGATVQYRVLAVDVQGNGGTPIAFSVVVCRNPQSPAIGVDFNSTGDIVVSEA